LVVEVNGSQPIPLFVRQAFENDPDVTFRQVVHSVAAWWTD
jgi:hypothetical protein